MDSPTLSTAQLLTLAQLVNEARSHATSQYWVPEEMLLSAGYSIVTLASLRHFSPPLAAYRPGNDDTQVGCWSATPSGHKAIREAIASTQNDGIIRECIEAHEKSFIILRTDTYSHSFAHFLRLVAIARVDFPSIKAEQIEIVHYAGDTYARTFGIEFPVPLGTLVPERYRRIKQHELTF